MARANEVPLNRAEAAREATAVALFDSGVWVFAALVAIIAVILGGEWLLRADTLPVQAVRFEGTFKHVTQSELEKAVMTTVSGNFLKLDLDVVKERVERLPWVQSASVRRSWPRDVYVQFTEQQLLARWNTDGWVNQAMQSVRVSGNDLPQDLPRLEGPEGTQALVFERFHTLNELLTTTGLKLNRLMLTPRRTWQLELDGGMMLVLDRDDPEKKVERFTRVWPQIEREAKEIKQIDLRYANGFAVQLKTGRISGT